MAKTNTNYEKYFNDLVADEIKFCDTLENIAKMIYGAVDAEDIMELIETVDTLVKIKKNQLEEYL